MPAGLTLRSGKGCCSAGCMGAMVATLVCVVNASTAAGSLVTYAVDPSRSTLVVSGTFAGIPLQTISFGSTEDPMIFDGFTTTYQGTIITDRDAAAGTLQIVGARIAGGNWNLAPLSPDPENYSFYTPFGPNYPVSSTFQGAVRAFSFSLTSPVITSPGSFDASQLRATISSGRLDWAIWSFNAITIPPSWAELDGTSTLGGGLPLAPGVGSWTDLGGVGALSIPVDTDILTEGNGHPVLLHLSGTIVATTPEPSGALLVFVLFGLTARRSRKRVTLQT